MKAKSIVTLVCAVLGFAALADYYQFSSGVKIPLFDTGKNALSYVTLQQNAKCDGTVYEMTQSANGQAPVIVVNLENAAAGDYVFYFKGSSKNAPATYTATITGVDDQTYAKTFTGTQSKTDNWPIDDYGTDHNLWLSSLPAGKFTLTFTVSCSDGWMGHYGNFTFTKVDATLDVAANLASTIDLGVPYSDSSNRFDTQTLEGWVSLVRTATDTTQSRLLLENEGRTLGSTKHGDTVTFYLHVGAKANYSLVYQAGTASGNTGVSIAWSLFNAETDNEVYSTSNAVTPNSDNKWTLSNSFSNSFGALEAGYYVLTATVQRPLFAQNWACNFGNFSFGATIELDGNSAGQGIGAIDNLTVDLKGHNLTLNPASVTLAGKLTVTNTDTENIGTLTLSGAVTTAWLTGITVSGNVKLALDGITSDIDFEKTDASAIASTHTGGTVFKNFGGKKVSIYKSANIGTGVLTLQNGGYLSIPSGNAQNGAANPWANDIAIYGTGNRMDLQGSQYGDLYFTGDWSGNGSVWVHNGWQPTIYFANADGNNDGFSGTLSLTYRGKASTKGFVFSGASNGFKNGTVVLTNDYGNIEAKITRVLLQPAGGNVYFGRLATDGQGVDYHTGTAVLNNSASALALYVGATGVASDNDVFEGSISDSGKGAITFHKEGAGTLTLKGSTASTISGGIEVDGGTLYIDTTFTSATSVNVNEGASFYGTVPANGTATWKAGSIIDCAASHTIDGNGTVVFNGAIVDAGNVADIKEGVFLTVKGTVTGTPVLSDNLKAVKIKDGFTGRWILDYETANGVRTYSLVWKKDGMMLFVI